MSDPKKIYLTVPNFLSLFRIAVGVFIICGIIESWTNILFWGSVACVFDFFDGGYARKYKVISYLGEVLDPTGDKILVVAVLLRVNVKLGILVAILEAVASIFAYLYRFSDKENHFIANGSKAITATQMIILLIFALSKLDIYTGLDSLSAETYGFMAGLSSARLFMYTSVFWEYLKEKRKRTLK